MLIDLVTYGQIVLYRGYQFIAPSSIFRYTVFIIAYHLIFVVIKDGILKQNVWTKLCFLLN